MVGGMDRSLGLDLIRRERANRAGKLCAQGAGAYQRFERTGAVPDIDSAIVLWLRALEVIPRDDTDRTEIQTNLSYVLRIRSGLAPALPGCLDMAVDLGRRAVDAIPAGHPQRAAYLCNLSAALAERFQRTNKPSDLDQAMEAAEQAADVAPAGSVAQGACLSNLAAAYGSRYIQSGKLSDADLAVTLCRRAVDAVRPEASQRAGFLTNLGLALLIRCVRAGQLSDLDEGIEASREAVDATPAGHPDRPGYLANLGSVLRARYDRTRALEDLDEAIEVGRQSAEIVAADDPWRPVYLSNLGNALAARSQRAGGEGELERAVAVHRQAVDATPADDPNRARHLSMLAAALVSRFEDAHESADLEEAIVFGREAVELTPAEHAMRPLYLNNLADALRNRAIYNHDEADLDEAITVGRLVVDATPADHPLRARYLSNLCESLSVRYERVGERTDLEEAILSCEEALAQETAEPYSRIVAAFRGSRIAAAAEPRRAAELLERAVGLLPGVAPRRLGRADQQDTLGVFAGLAADAAALALADPSASDQDRAARALGLLEAGRAVLFSQALDTRNDLTDLAGEHPELANRFERLRDQLDQVADETTAAMNGTFGAISGPAFRHDHIARDRRRLAGEFDDLMAEIRAQAGFASFGLPPSAAELVSQAAAGPVVVFNVSIHRSDAFLVTADGITTLPLPDLTVDAVTDQVIAIGEALDSAVGNVPLVPILGWLWEHAVGPVLEALGPHLRPGPGLDWPRVWWVPGGLLSLLPIHAAGRHANPPDPDSPPDPAAMAAMDRVVSSYTPSIRALRYSRQHASRASSLLAADSRALIVAMPTTPGIPGRLPYAYEEAIRIASRLPDPVLLVEPGPAIPAQPGDVLPTAANVLALLPACDIAHFSCHGESSPTDPSLSRLLLHDHDTAPFTVAALAPVRLENARLAYLSACSTAVTDTIGLVDEAIHLTSAFQLAGYPHVIGTLWPIDDERAAGIADRFYASLATHDGLDVSLAAHGLHHAIRDLRHKLGGNSPLLWAAHLHAGA
jgi:tetratricopeptide (TPR) repeat protein